MQLKKVFRRKNAVKVSETTLPQNQTKGSQQLVRYIANYAFQGDANAFQLSFKAGGIILADPRLAPGQDWIWVMDAETSRQGWCPRSYLTPEPVTTIAPPPATPAPLSASGSDDFVLDGGDDGGFSGEIMGGHAASTNNFFNIGTSVQDMGRQSMAAVSTGAQKAGEFTKNVAQQSKYRVQDMTARHNNQNHTMKVKATPVNRHGRTPGEQKAVNIGNRAAQGAAAGSAVGLIFGGVRGATRGAVHCGAWGGASEAVRDWKPFG